MEQLTLKKVITSVISETKTIEDGIRISYRNWYEGEVKLKDGRFCIVWDDESPDTPLDGSEKTKSILADCNFE